jgi:hypothetical protein
MDIFSHLNYLAIITGALIYFILGALWYSKFMFVKQWGEANKIDFTDTSNKGHLPMMLVISFLMMLIASIGLAILTHMLGIVELMGGVKLGLLCGGCFSVASTVTNYVYLNKPRILYFIDGGYHLVGFILAGIVLAVWH